MDANIRTMLADGHLYTLLDSLGTPDGREDLLALSHDVRDTDAVITVVSIGASTLVLTPAGLQVVVHDHEESHAECWRRLVDNARERVEAHNATMREIREDAEAQEMLAAGMPAPLVFMMTGHDLPDGVGL